MTETLNEQKDPSNFDNHEADISDIITKGDDEYHQALLKDIMTYTQSDKSEVASDPERIQPQN